MIWRAVKESNPTRLRFGVPAPPRGQPAWKIKQLHKTHYMSVRYSNLKLRARLLAGDVPGWLQRHPRRAYLTQLILATPPWYCRAEVVRLDKKAHMLSVSTGHKHVVDHVIPITHKRVCGLNVQGNLQVIEARVNAAKSNHWCEWHGELFSEPEQFAWRF